MLSFVFHTLYTLPDIKCVCAVFDIYQFTTRVSTNYVHRLKVTITGVAYKICV